MHLTVDATALSSTTQDEARAHPSRSRSAL
jgi:hypothetical protein